MSVDVMQTEKKKKDPLQTVATGLQIYSAVSNMGGGKAPKADGSAATGQSSAMSRRYESSKQQYENSGSF